MTIGPVENHRQRELGDLVYPVYSRRSLGLSVGVNLFPDQKRCPFDCPYCEVFPIAHNDGFFSLERLEAELRSAIAAASEQNAPVRDICFSGNGEPSLSPEFPRALRLAGRLRGELVPAARLVLITNGAGLLEPALFSLLRDAAAGPLALDIWLKLDAGTAWWYQRINRCAIPFEKLTSKIGEFTARAPVTIQTMLCAVDGSAPPPEEEHAWERLLVTLALGAAAGPGGHAAPNAAAAAPGIRKAQLYGKARPAPEDPRATALPAAYLEKRAASLRAALSKAGVPVLPIEVYP